MRITKFIIAGAFVLLWLGPVNAERDSDARKGPVFCEQKIPFKIFMQAYVVSAKTQSQPNGLAGIGKEWFKEDENSILYHGEQIEFPGNTTNLLIEGEPISAQWEDCDKKTGLCTFYGMNSNSDGTKFCWKYKNVKIDDPEIHIPKLERFYANEITGEKTIIGGLECQKLTSPRIYKTEDDSFDGRVSAEEKENWVNRNFCLPLYKDVDIQSPIGNGQYKIQSVNLSNDFPDSVFTPPENCQETPWISGGMTGGGDAAVIQQGGVGDPDSGSPEDPCLKRCREMKKRCLAQKMDVKADGSGCYTPCQGPNCPYERNCEAVCLSR